MTPELSRIDYVRAVLASGGDAEFQPVHVQKLFFLLDDKLSDAVGGPYFNFQPYDYGPFDREVYDCLDELRKSGDLQVGRDWRALRHYSLTPHGRARGQKDLMSLGATRNVVRKWTEWVLGQSFTSLVSAIYKAYPHMKANSVFNER